MKVLGWINITAGQGLEDGHGNISIRMSMAMARMAMIPMVVPAMVTAVPMMPITMRSLEHKLVYRWRMGWDLRPALWPDDAILFLFFSTA